MAVEAECWLDIYQCCKDAPDLDEVEFDSWDGHSLVCKAFGEKPKDFVLNDKCDVKFIS